MLRLITNKIRCKFCGDIIESRSVHDFVRCRCGKCSTDGGHEYAQRSFFTENPEDTYEDLSTYVNPETGEIVPAKEATKDDIPFKPIWIEIKEVEDPKEETHTSPTLDIPEVTEAVEAEPTPVPVLRVNSGTPDKKAEVIDVEEVIIKRDKNGKPISGKYPYGKKN